MRRAGYAVLSRLLAPVMGAVLWRRAARNHVPAARRLEWLGRGAAPPSGTWWVHAASVGEVEAALPLIRGLRERFPEVPVLVTTTTPEGAERITAAGIENVHHRFLPLDLPGAVRRFVASARPRAGVIVETELWPYLFAACERAGVPLVLASGRLSDRAFRRYQRQQPLIGEVLGVPRRILAQDAAAAERFRFLGAPPSRVEIGGNLKFDRDPPAGAEGGAALRAALWSAEVPVWAAVSTREGEDEAVLAAHAALRRRHPDARLIWVPRHPQRFDAVARAAADAGLSVARRSLLADAPGRADREADVLLGDTLGEMGLYLAAADVAFVGGSLVPLGGQNLLEPAALGRPVLTGPDVSNFAAVARALDAVEARIEVADGDALGAALAGLCDDPERGRRMAVAGQDVVASGRGAVARVLGVLEETVAAG